MDFKVVFQSGNFFKGEFFIEPDSSCIVCSHVQVDKLQALVPGIGKGFF